MAEKAIVFLSGGVDSTTCLAIALDQGYECFALTFDYAQRHRVEIEAARRVAQFYDMVQHWICRLDLPVRSSALTNDGLALSSAKVINTNTYVPARNTIFLAYALSWAEDIGASAIFFGANADDRAQYPDCRPKFVSAFQGLIDAVNAGDAIHIKAPLLNDSKAGIIRKGLSLGVDYDLTWSCYNPTDASEPCQQCGACQLRKKGFEEVSGSCNQH